MRLFYLSFIEEREAMDDRAVLYGRELVLRDIERHLSKGIFSECHIRPAFTIEKGHYKCNRCQTLSSLKNRTPVFAVRDVITVGNVSNWGK